MTLIYDTSLIDARFNSQTPTLPHTMTFSRNDISWLDANTPIPERLILDMNFYAISLSEGIPDHVDRIIQGSQVINSTIVLNEMTYRLGYYKVENANTASRRQNIKDVIESVNIDTGWTARSSTSEGDAGIFKGDLCKRFWFMRDRDVSNDVSLAAQAIELKATILTNNWKEFGPLQVLHPELQVIYFKRP